MTRLFLMIYGIAFHLVAGLLIVAALVAGYDGPVDVLIAAGLGAVLTAPVAWITTKNMYQANNDDIKP